MDTHLLAYWFDRRSSRGLLSTLSFSLVPAGEVKPKTREEFTESLRKACKCMEDLKRMMNLTDDRDRFKRAPSFRR